MTTVEFQKVLNSLFVSNFSSQNVDEDTRKLYAEILQQTENLSYFYGLLGSSDFPFNELSSPTMARFLLGDPTLTKLNLSFAAIKSKSLKPLAQALIQNNRITALHLTMNTLHKNSATGIVNIIDNYTRLDSLHLSWDEIEEGAIQRLAQGLKKNTTITSLSLNDNLNDSNIAKTLVEILNNNQTLTLLSILYCDIDASDWQAIAGALRNNSTLTKFNGIDLAPAEIRKTMLESLSRNVISKAFAAFITAWMIGENAQIKITGDLLKKTYIEHGANGTTEYPDLYFDMPLYAEPPYSSFPDFIKKSVTSSEILGTDLPGPLIVLRVKLKTNRLFWDELTKSDFALSESPSSTLSPAMLSRGPRQGNTASNAALNAASNNTNTSKPF